MSVDRYAILRCTLTGIKRTRKINLPGPDVWKCAVHKNEESDDKGFCGICGKPLVKQPNKRHAEDMALWSILDYAEEIELHKFLSKKAINAAKIMIDTSGDDDALGFNFGETEDVTAIKGNIYKAADKWMLKHKAEIKEIAKFMGRTGKKPIGYDIEIYLQEYY